MNNQRTFREIKDQAFGMIKENYWQLVLVCLVASAIIGVVTSISSGVSGIGSTISDVFSNLLESGDPNAEMVGTIGVLVTMVISTPITLIFGVIAYGISMIVNVGLSGYFINTTRGNSVKFVDVFGGFRKHFMKNAWLGILVELKVFLWSLIGLPVIMIAAFVFAFCMVFLVQTLGSGFYVIFALIAICIYIIICLAACIPAIIATIRYSFAPFCMAENPELGAYDAIKKSIKITKGKVGRVFLFGLSLIGWYLLIFVTCGLASLFIQPYFNTAYALLYNDLSGYKEDVVEEIPADDVGEISADENI